MKKNYYVYAIIIGLTLAVTASIFFYYRFYLPGSNITASYVEFYQEYVASDYNSINISSINHDVIIAESSDELIHISYFQKRDNSNIYTTDNKKISISIIEKAEEVDSIFNSSSKLKDIIIYLPASCQITVVNSTVSGSFQLKNIALKNVSAESVSGNIKISGCGFNYISLKSNYGNITLEKNSGDIISVENVTGNITLQLENSKENYDMEIKSEYGPILFNGERVYSLDEEEKKVYIYEYYQKLDNSSKIKLSAMRGQIAVYFSHDE